MDNKAVRYVNVAVGVWIFISAFAWHHSGAQFTNTWIMGLITTVVALVSLTVPSARFVNTAGGIWLVLSAFLLPAASAGTMWNNLIFGIIVAVVSVIGARPGAVGTSRPFRTT
ncbi:MAG TPA: SPW repeat protein [Polyangia bacterium]